MNGKSPAFDTVVNSLALGMFSAGAVAFQQGKYEAGVWLMVAGALLEYFKYSKRYLERKINGKRLKGVWGRGKA